MKLTGGWVGLLLQGGLMWGQSAVQLPAHWTIKQWAGSDSWTWTMTQKGPNAWSGMARHDQTGQQGSWDFTLTKTEGNRITLYRAGVGTYSGVASADGRSMNGTCDFIGGGWSATFASPIERGMAAVEKEKSLLPASFTMKQWSGSESWTWTMTQRTADNWGATVRQDQTGQQGSGSFTLTKVEGNRITMHRDGAGTYVGVVSADGRTITGTCDFISGGWSVALAGPVAGPPVTPPARSGISLPDGFTMKQWSGSESWTWTLTRRTADNWGATVRQDQSGQQGSGSFTVTKMDGNRITMFRDGAGTYVGVVSADGRTITGTCDFIGGGWSIALPGPGPRPGPTALIGVRYRVENLIFNHPEMYLNPRNYHGYMVDWATCTVRGLNPAADRGEEVIRVLHCRDRQRLTFTQTAPGSSLVEYDWVFLDGGKTIAGAYRQGPGFGPSVGGIY